MAFQSRIQYRFVVIYCDKCGNGFLSSFETSITGVAGSVLRAAGGLFGGILGRAGDSAYEIQRAVGGKAHDDALHKAVEEAKLHFKQCSRCGKWICPEVCWNRDRGLCENCAPDEGETIASAQAQVKAEQIIEKARNTNMVQDVNMNQKATAQCAQCGAKTKGGKFCPECGAPLVTSIKCTRCGIENEPGALFCPECGNKMTL